MEMITYSFNRCWTGFHLSVLTMRIVSYCNTKWLSKRMEWKLGYKLMLELQGKLNELRNLYPTTHTEKRTISTSVSVPTMKITKNIKTYYLQSIAHMQFIFTENMVSFFTFKTVLQHIIVLKSKFFRKYIQNLLLFYSAITNVQRWANESQLLKVCFLS